MYALETKKRKFDRILDSIAAQSGTSSTNNPTRRSGNRSTVSLVGADSVFELEKKRRLEQRSPLALNASATSLAEETTANYLPFSRPAFLDRLKTFGPVTRWHLPSNEPINAAEWAARGWRCVGTDTVGCGACDERLLIKLDAAASKDSHDSSGEQVPQSTSGPASPDEGYELDSDIYTGMVAKYKRAIVNAHKENCPWHRKGCSESIQRIEGLLNAPTTLSHLQARYESLINVVTGSSTPKVRIDTTESSELAQTSSPMLENICQSSADRDINAYKLAVCGWQKAEMAGQDVIECQHCFRHLGLWLYRGEEPTVEKLDAVESHLEYCPWRSAAAQNTDLEVNGQKGLVSGWILVVQAAAKQISKASATMGPAGVLAGPSLEQGNPTQAEVPEKEREKKMKDLLRRVKELKKPFNVKGLLKKKPKVS